MKETKKLLSLLNNWVLFEYTLFTHTHTYTFTHMTRIWHKVNFQAEFNKFKFIFFLLDRLLFTYTLS